MIQNNLSAILDKTNLIHVKHLNSQGLSKNNINEINSSLLYNKDCHIILTTETWGMNIDLAVETGLLVVNNSATKTSNLGRASCGIAVFASPQFKQEITIIKVHTFFIKFKLRSIIFVVIYLPPRLRSIQIESIMRELENYDILCGDINMNFCKDIGHKSLLSTDSKRTAFLSNLYSNIAFVPTSDRSTPHLDHLLSIPHLVLSYLNLPMKPFESDHKTIQLFTVDISNHFNPGFPSFTTPPSTSRISYQRAHDPQIQQKILKMWFSYTEKLVNIFNKYNAKLVHANPAQSVKIIDNCNDILTSVISQIAIRACGTYNPKFVKSSPDNFANLLENTHSASATIRLFKRSCRNSNRKMVSSNNTGINNLTQEAIDHWKPIWNTADLPTGFDNVIDYDDTGSGFLYIMTPQNILNAIIHYPKAKSTGVDSISPIILSILCQSLNHTHNHNSSHSYILPNLLSILFKMVLCKATIPSAWGIARVTLIDKKAPSFTPKTSRPISLLSMLRRIFEILLLRAVQDKSWARLSPFQSAFRRGFSSYTNILYANEAYANGYTHQLFLDFDSAYDRLRFPILQKVLQQRGAPPGFINLIGSLMLRNAKSQLVVNDSEAPFFTRNVGLTQGGPLSPFLFTIFIDSLIHDLSSQSFASSSFPCTLWFADDGCIFTHTHQQMVLALHIVINWCQQNSMILNINKSGYLSDNYVNILNVNDQIIPNLQSYIYLGINKNLQAMDYATAITTSIDKMNKSLNAFKFMATKWSSFHRLVLYKTFVRSQLEYVLPFLSSVPQVTTRRLLKKQLLLHYKDSVCWIVTVSTNKYKTAAAILGLSDFKDLESYRRFAIYLKLSNMSNSFIDIKRCMSVNTSLLKKYEQSAQDISIKDFILQCRMQKLNTFSGVLVNSVIYRADVSLCDLAVSKSVTLQDSKIALSYRMNNYLVIELCPRCHVPIYRKHRSCLIRYFGIYNTTGERINVSDFMYYKKFVQKTKPSNDKYFTIIDGLLGSDHHHIAISTLKKWKDLLQPL